jgi:hypothetical protein
MMSNDSFDFQDSEVSSAELKDQKFVVRFSAGHVRRSTNQDGNNVEGFLHALELTISHPSVIQHEPGCVGRLSNGLLRVEGTTIKVIPLPYEVATNVEFELSFANGSTCKVVGLGVTLKATGEARIIEWLKC